MLYIVSTPIGNLDDLSYRQAKTLCESDIILAEDTRSAYNLFRKAKELFQLSPKPSYAMISYFKEKEMEKLPEILSYLKKDLAVSLVSESGMPLISDPGYLLVQTAVRNEIPYTVIPGPSSITTALALSGFPSDNVLFLGYLPKKESALSQLIDQLRQTASIFKEIVFVCFESPQRIQKTLEIFNRLIPDSDICICREMTKIYEEISRGKPGELMGREYRGEIVVVGRI